MTLSVENLNFIYANKQLNIKMNIEPDFWSKFTDDDNNANVKKENNTPLLKQSNSESSIPESRIKNMIVSDNTTLNKDDVQKVKDFSKVADIFLSSDLANLPVLENYDTSSEVYQRCQKQAVDMTEDFLTVVNRHVKIPKTHKIVQIVTSLQKFIATAMLTNPGVPYVKSEILYLLGKEKIHTKKKSGKLSEIVINDKGELDVDSGQVLRNRVIQTLESQNNKGDYVEEEEESDDELSPQEKLELIEKKNLKLQQIKKYSKETINAWVFLNMNVHRFLKILGGAIGNDILNTLVTLDITGMIFPQWIKKFEEETSSIKLDNIESKGLLTIKQVDEFVKSFKNSSFGVEKNIWEYIALDKRSPEKLASIVYGPTVYVAFLNAWSIVYSMLIRLKNKGGGKLGFSRYSDYSDERGIPDIRMILLPLEGDSMDFNCQVQFAGFVGSLFSVQKERLNDVEVSHFRFINNDARYIHSINILCSRLTDLGFNGISPQLN